MNNEQKNLQKEKLVRYLYPTKEIRGLMCNDIYQELLEVVELEKCIGTDNLDEGLRASNYEFVKGVIKGFIIGNIEYKKVLFEYYHHNNLDWITQDILIGLVLYISSISDEFKDVDIFKDKQSILYNQIYILDLIN